MKLTITWKMYHDLKKMPRWWSYIEKHTGIIPGSIKRLMKGIKDETL